LATLPEATEDDFSASFVTASLEEVDSNFCSPELEGVGKGGTKGEVFAGAELSFFGAVVEETSVTLVDVSTELVGGVSFFAKVDISITFPFLSFSTNFLPDGALVMGS
jgi:hypothetical protein